jgi:hypothetical protein
MKIQELYDSTSFIRESYNIYELRNPFFILPEFEQLNRIYHGAVTDLDINNKRAKLRFHMEEKENGVYYMSLVSIWMDDQPVMVARLANGKHGEFNKRLITDTNSYEIMIKYLTSLIELPIEYGKNEIVTVDSVLNI